MDSPGGSVQQCILPVWGPWPISRATMSHWEGEGSISAVKETQLCKGIQKGKGEKSGKRHLNLGVGCSSEALGDRWTPGSPKITFPMALAMYATATKVPGYTSAWDDPECSAWGKCTEPITVPR
eukprot:12412241-Karenia_brevis.AAC.1